MQIGTSCADALLTSPLVDTKRGAPAILMQPTIRKLEGAIKTPDQREVFVCDEESSFYSDCLADLVFANDDMAGGTILEFGTGDGSPVLNGLLREPFEGVIHGFELNSKAAELARYNALEVGLQSTYKVHNSCFFEGAAIAPATCLVSNPPYIAAPDADLRMPALFGGTDGANLTRDLMSLGLNSAMLLLCSYSDPVRTLAHASREGYDVVGFRVTDLPFGYYTSEPKVMDWISGMREDGRAFFSEHSYRLAGALLQKRGSTASAPGDKAAELLSYLMAA